jgi:zinc protease
MYQLEGATNDPSRVAGVHSLMSDYTETTPALMQALAAKYLDPAKAWRVEVLPQPRSAQPIASARN